MADQAILTAGQLRDRLDEAFARGLHPDTAVVVAGPADDHNSDWLTLTSVLGDPTVRPYPDTDPDYADWIWFTLFPAGPADARFTPEHRS